MSRKTFNISFGVVCLKLLCLGEMSKSPGSDSSRSTGSGNDAMSLARGLHESQGTPRGPTQEPDTASKSETEDEPVDELPNQSQYNRPQSSLSSHRYRTPMGGSVASPPPIGLLAAQQPTGFEIPSAFSEPPSVSTLCQGQGPTAVGQFYASSHDIRLSPHLYPPPPGFRGQPPITGQPFEVPITPTSRSTLEHAIENVQAHLAALNERLESLESMSGHPHRSNISLPTQSGSPRYRRPGVSPIGRHGDFEWDLNDLGLWSHVLSPVTRVGGTLRQLAKFFATSEHSPTLIVVRRLCLDMSFLFCVIWVLRALWQKTGVRRREVRLALKILLRAILGFQQERALVDRGV
jgi:hypothetical protein